MANLVARGGRVDVRVGGNTQETASLVASIPNGADLTKDYSNTQNPVRPCADIHRYLLTNGLFT